MSHGIQLGLFLAPAEAQVLLSVLDATAVKDAFEGKVTELRCRLERQVEAHAHVGPLEPEVIARILIGAHHRLVAAGCDPQDGTFDRSLMERIQRIIDQRDTARSVLNAANARIEDLQRTVENAIESARSERGWRELAEGVYQEAKTKLADAEATIAALRDALKDAR